jgi:general secretion pathway protein A
MYQSFFGLRELPFELTANPKYLFLTARQREALSTLQYGLMSAKSLTVLVGEAGTGKTTLIRAALDSDRCKNVRCVYLNNPMLSSADFVNLLAGRFNLGPEAAAAKSIFLERLESVLRERRAGGEITALVVDEAQSLSTELLEEIRLLANIETPSEKLLPLVLAGQPEFADRLENFELRQLKQRVALRCELLPFDLVDTAAYIASRISTAGGAAHEMFTQEAIAVIHDRSQGIPRTINVICDNALVNGMALGRRRVERALVEEVCRDLRLGKDAARAGSAGDPPKGSDGAPTIQLPAESGDAAAQADVAAEPPQQPGRFSFRFRSRSGTPLPPSARILT